MANFLLRRADVVRTVNLSVAKRLARDLGIAAERMDVIPVPVTVDTESGNRDSEADGAAGETESGERPTVLFVGRFSPAKNLSVWVDAAAQIHLARPDVRFVLAGDGPEREKIVRMIEERGLQDVFEIPGNVPVDRLWELYRAATVFMFSSDNEGLPRVLIEAMWAGLPVVSTANAGASEIISDESTGYVVPVGDAGGLAKRAVELLQNPVERQAMADRARTEARLNFDPAKLADEIALMWARAGNRTLRTERRD